MPIRVLIVDDSSFVREVLIEGLSRFSDIEVVGEASNGTRAEAAVVELSPDVVTMDVVMPMVSGLDAIRNIMARCPTPIVVVSDAYSSRRQLSLDAMRAGAVDVFPKPDGGFDEQAAQALAQTLRTAARTRPEPMRVSVTPVKPTPIRPVRSRFQPCQFIGIVTSTGGPQTLHRMLQSIDSKDLPPIAIVQHISPGFDKSLATWLNRCTPLDVRVAREHMVIRRGTVAIAPNDVHLEIQPGGIARLVDKPALNSHRPSGTLLLRSLAHSFGDRAMGVVLTGMGDDGADGAAELESRGGTILVQEPETAIIDGMPRSTIARTHSAVIAKLEQMQHFMMRH